ncbi:unnamed protein product [Rotaria sp. Silwood2]|nr:unnamed protein product [Rotaria sp. Silwood2]CAF4680938.1 unnamed protein product [Rotaria sp. Silwood2]CAF4843599.1 unnamed protein product [Rotaria sp. Silwood2]
MLTPQVQQQQEQQQSYDIQRNFLVIQTLRMEIAFLMSKRNLLEYDQQEIRKRQRKNAVMVLKMPVLVMEIPVVIDSRL